MELMDGALIATLPRSVVMADVLGLARPRWCLPPAKRCWGVEARPSARPCWGVEAERSPCAVVAKPLLHCPDNMVVPLRLDNMAALLRLVIMVVPLRLVTMAVALRLVIMEVPLRLVTMAVPLRLVTRAARSLLVRLLITLVMGADQQKTSLSRGSTPSLPLDMVTTAATPVGGTGLAVRPVVTEVVDSWRHAAGLITARPQVRAPGSSPRCTAEILWVVTHRLRRREVLILVWWMWGLRTNRVEGVL